MLARKFKPVEKNENSGYLFNFWKYYADRLKFKNHDFIAFYLLIDIDPFTFVYFEHVSIEGYPRFIIILDIFAQQN